MLLFFISTINATAYNLLTEQEHVHAGALLEKLPDRIFGSAEDVVRDLRFL
jgi:hypothetical protein